jgi:hypothetical protein
VSFMGVSFASGPLRSFQLESCLSLHVVLLGDSIFDNAAYVPRGCDVSTHLRAKLADSGSVTMLAVDGAVIDDVHAQLRPVPRDATHLVVSVGGNDALRYAHLLDDASRSGPRLLQDFAAGVRDFDERYRRLLRAFVHLDLPAYACTIYEGNLPTDIAQKAAAALGMFNDVIYRRCAEAGVRVMELRNVCTEASDYANPIEPSNLGGRKIADAIGSIVVGKIQPSSI